MTFLSEHRTGEPASFGLMFDLRQATTMPTGEELRGFANLLATLTRGAPHGRARHW